VISFVIERFSKKTYQKSRISFQNNLFEALLSLLSANKPLLKNITGLIIGFRPE